MDVAYAVRVERAFMGSVPRVSMHARPLSGDRRSPASTRRPDMTSSYRPRAGITSSEPRYRLLVDAVTDYAIYMLDMDGFVISWNAGARRLKGHSEQDAPGQHFSSFFLEDDVRAGRPQQALTTAEREGHFSAEGWRMRKDGSRFWALVVIHAIRDAQGALLGFAKVTQDLTERKKAEEALRRSEQQLRLLFHSVTDYAIHMIGPDGIITNWNAGAQRIRGYMADEVVGTSFTRFYPPKDQASACANEPSSPPCAKVDLKRKGGACARTVPGSGPSPSSIPSTMQMAIISALRRSNVTSPRSAPPSRRWRRPEKTCSRRRSSKPSVSCGGVAHDLYNLLMVVLSSLTLARRRLSAEQHGVLRLLDNAAAAARRGVSLTQRMLAFARCQPLSPTAVDLSKLIDDMPELLQQSVGPTVELAVEVPADLSKAVVDSHQLEVAILNLAVNAHDAIPNGGRLTVMGRTGKLHEAELGSPNGVCVAVCDTGLGMDPATLARATEPFFTTKGTGKGTGVRLPMVHGLAAQPGGNLGLTSQPGRGTVAAIWLPIAQGDERSGSVHTEDPVPPEHRAGDGAGGRRRSARARQRRLRAGRGRPLGAAIWVCEEALHLSAGDCAVDLVLTDYAMPRMNGVELVQQLARLGHRLPVIFASGFAEAGAGTGLDLVQLNKPFNQEELRAAVQQELRTAQSPVMADDEPYTLPL